MIGVRAPDGGDDFLLGVAIDVRNEVITPLARDLDGVETREAPYDDVAGSTGGPHCDVE